MTSCFACCRVWSQIDGGREATAVTEGAGQSMSLEKAISTIKADAKRFGQARVARVANISAELVCRMMKGTVPQKPESVDKVVAYASGANIEFEREQRQFEDALDLLRQDARKYDAYQVAQASGLSVGGVGNIVMGQTPVQIKCIDKIIAYASRRDRVEWHAPSNKRIKNLAFCMAPEKEELDRIRRKK